MVSEVSGHAASAGLPWLLTSHLLLLTAAFVSLRVSQVSLCFPLLLPSCSGVSKISLQMFSVIS